MKVAYIALTLTWVASAGSLTTFSFTGALSTPDDVFLQAFHISDISDITIQTWGYGGGTNAGRQLITPGGFDPLVAIFAPDGSFMDLNDDGTCPPGNPDSFNCFDSTLFVPAAQPGTYTLALTSSPNSPAGLTLLDGFTGGGDFDGRSGNYAVDVAIQSDAAAPELAPNALILSGIGMLYAWQTRRRRDNT